MSKLEKLDLMGVSSLAAVTVALLVGWMATTHDLAVRHARSAPQEPAVTLSGNGSMKLTVKAAAEEEAAPAAASTRTASARPTASQALQVALPLAMRP